MTWQQNLINNLIVWFIIGSLIVIIYLRVKNQTLTEMIRDIKEGFQSE